ncbi:MAG: adenosylmethionine decarboxylase [Burkholderiales bacterium]
MIRQAASGIRARRLRTPSQIPVQVARSAPGMLGSQVVLDLYECESEQLDDIEWVKETMLGAARAAGATIVETVFHKFAPWGISGVVVIAESHLAIHIWPENRYAAIDVFTCGDSVHIEKACDLLSQAFQSKRPVQLSFARGEQLTRDYEAKSLENRVSSFIDASLSSV